MHFILLYPLYLAPSIITMLYFCKGGHKLRFDTSSMKNQLTINFRNELNVRQSQYITVLHTVTGSELTPNQHGASLFRNRSMAVSASGTESSRHKKAFHLPFACPVRPLKQLRREVKACKYYTTFSFICNVSHSLRRT